MKTIKYQLFFLVASFVLFSCGKKQESVAQESNLIEITKQQFATDSMALGKIETKDFESIVKCNGSFVSLPNGMAKLNAPVNGIIKAIHCHSGQSVTKNQALIEITGNEIIDTQKEFAEVAANFKRVKNEYDRVKLLFDEKVSSEKDFILAESEYKTYRAKYNGLKLRLDAIGLSTSKIENGEFHASYTLKSPITGYISKLNASIGSYVDSQSELLEIINPSMLQIKLSVFATDIADLKKGQTVRFKSAKAQDYNLATLTSIGVSLDKDTKSIECYASLATTKLANAIANEFIECEIITSTDAVPAIPTDAIVKTETSNVILVLEKQENEIYYFKKVEVNIGKQQNSFSEILDNSIEGSVLTKGAYNINAN